jgi:hypothetical protein
MISRNLYQHHKIALEFIKSLFFITDSDFQNVVCSEEAKMEISFINRQKPMKSG